MNYKLAMAGICLSVIAGCADLPTENGMSTAPKPLAQVMDGTEEEIYGRVYENGIRVTGSSYEVMLRPLDPETRNRLASDFDSVMGLQASREWSYGWSDPLHPGLCGVLGDWPNPAGRAAEAHGGSGPERHCVRAGKYELTLKSGLNTIQTILIDYVETNTSPIPDSTASGLMNMLVEHFNPGQSQSYGLIDVEVNFDIAGGGTFASSSYTDTPILDIDVGGSQTYTAAFANVASPSAMDTTLFRFSAQRSTSTWAPVDGANGVLTRLFYRTGFNGQASNFYTPRSGPSGVALARTYRYSDHRNGNEDTTSAITAGLELRNPTEAPVGSAEVSRSITAPRYSIGPSVLPSSAFESVYVTTGTDQYLDGSQVESGSNLVYTWHLNGASVTAPAALYDFSGFISAGTPTVYLTVQDTVNNTSRDYERTVNVASGGITISGEQTITSKQAYAYTSSLAGAWYERFAPSTTWYDLITDTTISRVWPAGEYTVDLRTQTYESGALSRGRLPITVCTASQSCGTFAAPAQSAKEPFESLFGIGPVVSWGTGSKARAIQYYQLNGLHTGNTSFRTTSWLAATSGSENTQLDGGTIGWTNSTTTDSVRIFDFDATPPFGQDWAFGLSIDPDIGTNAADDRSGYDSDLGLLYAFDENGAVGYMLRENNKNAVYSVTQYGAKRFAPVGQHDVWQTQRQAGTRLMTGPSDIQFILSARSGSGERHYRLIAVRAANVAALRALAAKVATN